MSFAHPWVLPIVLLPAAWAVWAWNRHGHAVVLPADHGAPQRRRIMRFFLNGAHSLPALIAGVVIILLAGPQQFSEPRAKRSLTNIQFVLDVSGSMMSSFGDGDRYDAAMAAILEFIGYRDGDAFGLTAFGDDFIHWCPLTSDPGALKCAPPFLNPRKLPRWFSQGTSIGKALEAAMKIVIQREEGDRLIILLTDGYSFDLYNGNDEKIGAKLRDAGITVYCIHIDNTEPPLEVQTIAQMTGGQVFAAGDPEGLKTIFRRIDEMAKARIENVSAESQDNFQPWCVAGGSLLGMLVMSSLGLRFVPW